MVCCYEKGKRDRQLHMLTPTVPLHGHEMFFDAQCLRVSPEAQIVPKARVLDTVHAGTDSANLPDDLPIAACRICVSPNQICVRPNRTPHQYRSHLCQPKSVCVSPYRPEGTRAGGASSVHVQSTGIVKGGVAAPALPIGHIGGRGI